MHSCSSDLAVISFFAFLSLSYCILFCAMPSDSEMQFSCNTSTVAFFPPSTRIGISHSSAFIHTLQNHTYQQRQRTGRINNFQLIKVCSPESTRAREDEGVKVVSSHSLVGAFWGGNSAVTAHSYLHFVAEL